MRQTPIAADDDGQDGYHHGRRSATRRQLILAAAGLSSLGALGVSQDVAAQAGDNASGGSADPQDFGAIGDGVADDTSALRAAMATGREVRLRRGKTYLCSGTIVLGVPGQVLNGNGATLIRANQSGVTEWKAVQITAPDCKVRDLEMKGNKGNFSTYNWATMVEISGESDADRLVVERCYIHDFPGEGISVADSADSRVLYNTLINGNGNGIHYGSGGRPGVRGAKCVGNHVEDMNLDVAVGHADGCVGLSANVSDLLVSGNRFIRALTGVGAINGNDNLDITISDNEIRGMTRAAIDGNCPIGESSTNVLIEGNRIYDCRPLLISQQFGADSPNRPARGPFEATSSSMRRF